MQANANNNHLGGARDNGNSTTSTEKQASTTTATSSPYSRWRIPPPLQRLFGRFPLRIYPPCDLPLASQPRRRDKHTLYIFTNASDAASGAPSFNPSCLKWQTQLAFAHIPVQTIPSTNHASPTGALPFLLPATSAPTQGPSPAQEPITTTKLPAWIRSTSKEPLKQHSSPRLDAYATLLSHDIRLAYLYALYLDPHTFRSIASRLYLEQEPSSGNPLVQYALERPLRAAALTELQATSSAPIPTVDVERLLKNAEEALDALSVLLGTSPWFPSSSNSPSTGGHHTSASRSATQHGSSNEPDNDDQGDRQRTSEVGLFDDEADAGSAASSPALPGPLDAALFAYTHVMLELFETRPQDSPARRLYEAVCARGNLVEHRARVLRRYYPAYEAKRQRRFPDEK